MTAVFLISVAWVVTILALALLLSAGSD